MQTPADKSQNNQKQAIANGRPQSHSEGEQIFQFTDNRPEAITQRRLITLIKNQTAQQGSQSAPIQTKANNTGLPDNLKWGIENLSGIDISDVKVHYNSEKPSQLQAHAYAQGTDIHVAPGQEQHLPHEAWHVVQQKQGRVKPTLQLKSGVYVNDDGGMEREADEMGSSALKGIDRNLIYTDKETVQASGLMVIQRVNKIPRPQFTKEVLKAIRLSHGQHRRHIVMSSRMREAIWAYHMSDGLDAKVRIARRGELQKLVGKNTLRSEMAAITALTHNSMGNLFAGKGSENTAIGFSVNPLYDIAKKIEERKIDSLEGVLTAIIKWDKKGTFGFALEHKKYLAKTVLSWLNDKSNHGGNLEDIATAIQDFAFSCSFDFAYKEDEDEKHVFPEHIDEEIQGNLLKVATTLEAVIQKPKEDHPLYSALTYLLQIGKNKPTE